MPQFTPWAITNPAPNVLFNPAAVDQAVDTHQNQLLKQQADTIANAYAPQRNQLELDTGAIANQFATAKNPLEIQSLRQQLGLDPNPNRDQIMRLFSGDGTQPTSTAAGGGSTTETADDLTRAAAVRDGLIQRGMQPDGATAFAANALHESKANPFTGAGDAGASHGIFQWNGDRLAAFKAANGGLLPEQTSLDKQLDFVVSELRGPESTAAGRIMSAQGVGDKAGQVSEAYLRPKDTVPEMQRRSATALRLAGAWGGQGAPGSSPGVSAPPAATAVGPAVGAPGGPNITPGMTDQAWLDEMAKRYPAMAGPNDTSQRPNATAQDGAAQPPAPYQVASNTPVAPPLPPNQMAPGGERGPPAPTAPTAPAAAPAQTSLPRMADVPSGMARPEAQQAQQLLRRATQIELLASQTPKDLATQQAAKAAADNLKLRAQQLLQTDSVVQTQEGQFHPMTGALGDPVKPLANFVWNQERKAFVDTGGHYPPVTPRPGSITVLPDGRVYQSDPGGGVTDITRTDPAGIAARKAAEAQGTQAGTASGKLPTELANQGAEANRAISTLDEGAHNIALAKQGGINSGYFAPWLTGLASIAKSIGGEDGTKLLGIDPTAVGDIQTARKTLAIVSSSILKQALGDSQITDAKIEHFIHAQPGIETDPDALGRVMNWARSQFVYEREMAAQAMEDTSPETGTLPLNWKQKYYSKHGFGPIYNPEAAEMQQPDGRVPSREPPSTRAAAPASSETLPTATGPNGEKIILRGGQWQLR